MTTKININGSVAEIVLSGRLDTEAAPLLQQEITPISKDEGIKDIIIDMKDVDYVASAGLRVMLTCFQLVKMRGGAVRVVNVQEAVSKVFIITGLDKFFTFS